MSGQGGLRGVKPVSSSGPRAPHCSIFLARNFLAGKSVQSDWFLLLLCLPASQWAAMGCCQDEQLTLLAPRWGGKDRASRQVSKCPVAKVDGTRL